MGYFYAITPGQRQKNAEAINAYRSSFNEQMWEAL